MAIKTNPRRRNTPAPVAPKAKPVAPPSVAQGDLGMVAPPSPTGWRNPNANYAETDQSIDARMWRLSESRKNA